MILPLELEVVVLQVYLGQCSGDTKMLTDYI